MKFISRLETRELIDRIQIDAASISVAHTALNLQSFVATTDEQRKDAFDTLKVAIKKAQGNLEKLAKMVDSAQKESLEAQNG